MQLQFRARVNYFSYSYSLWAGGSEFCYAATVLIFAKYFAYAFAFFHNFRMISVEVSGGRVLINDVRVTLILGGDDFDGQFFDFCVRDYLRWSRGQSGSSPRV